MVCNCLAGVVDVVDHYQESGTCGTSITNSAVNIITNSQVTFFGK